MSELITKPCPSRTCLLLYSFVIIHLLNLNMTHFAIGLIHTCTYGTGHTRDPERTLTVELQSSPLCNTKVLFVSASVFEFLKKLADDLLNSWLFDFGC
jgi:hypothetical protein